jgi:hypothetical protein
MFGARSSKIILAALCIASIICAPVRANDWKLVSTDPLPAPVEGLMSNTLVFSDDLPNYYGIARQDGKFLVQIGKQAHRPFDKVLRHFLRFVPGQRDVAFLAQRDGGTISVVSAVETPLRGEPLFSLVPPPHFVPAKMKFGLATI